MDKKATFVHYLFENDVLRMFEGVQNQQTVATNAKMQRDSANLRLSQPLHFPDPVVECFCLVRADARRLKICLQPFAQRPACSPSRCCVQLFEIAAVRAWKYALLWQLFSIPAALAPGMIQKMFT